MGATRTPDEGVMPFVDHRLLRALFEQSPDVLYILHLPSGRTEYLNRHGFCGYTADELQQPGSILSAVSDEDAAAVESHWRAITRGDLGPTGNIDYRLRAKDGSWAWIRSQETVLDRDEHDGPTRLLVQLSVITEQKRVEAELLAERDFSRSLIDASPMFFVALTGDARIHIMNRSMLAALGYTEEEALGADYIKTFVPAEDREMLRQTFSRFVDGHQPAVIENHVLTKSGEKMLIEWHGSPLVSPADDDTYFFGVGIDITHRRRIEKALRLSTAQLLEAQRMAHIGHWELDLEDGIPVWSEEIYRIHGLDPRQREPTIMDYKEHVYPEDWPLVRNAITQAVKDGTPYDLVYRTILPTGEVRWQRAITKTIRNETSTVTKLFGTAQDITEFQRAEQALRESEERLSSFMQSASDGFYLLDAELVFVDANDHGLQLVGRTREELIGKRLAEILPEPNRSAQLARCEEVLRTGEPVERESAIGTPGLGERRYDMKVFQVGDGLGIIASDVTERVRAARVIESTARRLRELRVQLERAEEEERRRIARELHDQVSQNLTAVSITLSSSAAAIPDSLRGLAEQLAEAKTLIEETSENIRSLTFDLRPPVLDDFGIVAAIRWYADRIIDQSQFTVSISGEEPRPRLPSSTEMALFRIVQEALTNVAKHANASSVSIEISADGSAVRLRIEDDGKGLSPDDPAREEMYPRWGLLNMRERAEALGGTFTVDSSEGEGTRILVIVPR